MNKRRRSSAPEAAGAAGGDTLRFMQEAWGIPPALILALEEAESSLGGDYALIDARASYNQLRLLHIFQTNGVTDFHLNGSTGYGYGDAGR